jgi:YHS domain-containing protein
MDRRNLLLVGLVAGLSFGLGTAHGLDDRLAIKGYDPVAYFTDGKPTIGDPQYEYEWDGAVYQFASAEHLNLFEADPDRYAPQYQNWCTAALSKGYRVVADPNYWLIHEGRLYLFGKAVGPGKFAADPAAMVSNAEANYPRVSELPQQ